MKLRSRLWLYGQRSMLLSAIVLIGCLQPVNFAMAQDTDKKSDKTEKVEDEKESTKEVDEDEAEDVYDALDDEYKAASVKFRKELSKMEAKERGKFMAENSPTAEFSPKYLAFYEKYKDSDETVAFKALRFVISRGSTKDKNKAAGFVNENHPKNIAMLKVVGGARGVSSKRKTRSMELMMENFGDQIGTLQLIAASGTGDLKEKAMTKLMDDFADSKEMVPALLRMSRAPKSESTEKFLRGVSEKSENDQVKGIAMYMLGKYLISHNPEKAEDEIAKTFNSVIEDYGDEIYSEARGTKLKAVAKPELFAFQHLRIGKTAPEINGEDIDGKSFKLSDYRGKVVMIDFWGDW